MSRAGASKVFLTCIACGSSDRWEGSEEVWRVNGQEGSLPEKLIVWACECGSQQTE